MLKDWNRKLILASGSPRRAELLGLLEIPFDIKVSDCDESYPPELHDFEVAQFIAKKKAEASKKFIISDDEVIITADSIVALNGQIYGKPMDTADAYRILCFLSGKVHQVYTGVCVFDSRRFFTFTSMTEVYFREFTHEEIVWYIDKYKPFDKAGAYGIQDWVGKCKISKIEGSYTNVMGLPLDLVYESLKIFIS